MSKASKIERFIEEYLVDFNGTQAAIRAGYSKRTASVQASQLLAKLKVREIVEKRKKELADACGVTREELVNSTREVRDRCRMSGHRFQPQYVLAANRLLADLTGQIVTQAQVHTKSDVRILFDNFT